MVKPFRLVDVPEGKGGVWEVSRFSPDDSGCMIHNIREPARTIGHGPYTRLTKHDSVVMSDTPAELRDLFPLFGHLEGRMLFNGLGLGVALQGALDKQEVQHVTVIEISSDVISLVAGHYKERYGDRLTVIHADALIWKPPKGTRYNAVWHDIWPDICGDYWPEMVTLSRRYGKRCDWQSSWCRYQTRRAAHCG
ncbi:hypothetical protein LCGC14_3098140 [marine sediment metagenome]|uniref:PABS domain-containing protein n=1 Tax=marine sediment metagenome TaxID=412755 RepID=A0A0F8W907_9ZZZZ